MKRESDPTGPFGNKEASELFFSWFPYDFQVDRTATDMK